MGYLIALGYIQTMILPGLLFTYVTNKLNIVERIALAAFLSIPINYILVEFLVSISGYEQYSMFIIIALEFLVLIIIFPKLSKDYFDLINSIRNFFSKNKLKNEKIISMLFIIMVLAYIVKFAILFRSNMNTVFFGWDAIVSWNKWAVDWYYSAYSGSFGYPQGIPIQLSIIYKLADASNIQTYSKLIFGYYAFWGGVLLFLSTKYEYKNIIFFSFAPLIYLNLISNEGSPWFIFGGYVDPIMAAFSCLLIFVYFKTKNEILQDSIKEKKIQLVFYLALSAACFVKITGIYLISLFITYIFYSNYKIGNFRNLKSFFIGNYLSIIILIFSIHWFLINYFLRNDFPISTYMSLQDSRIYMRPILFSKIFVKLIGIKIFTLIIIGIFAGRKYLLPFTLYFIPIYIIVSIVAGYDNRAAFIMIGPLALVSSMGLCYVLNIVITKFSIISGNVSIIKNKNKFVDVLPILAIIFTILFLSNKIDRETALEYNTSKLIEANNVGIVNQTIYDLLEEDNTLILSCYQLPYALPNSRNKFYPIGDCSENIVNTWIGRNDVKFYLHWERNSDVNSVTLTKVFSILDDKKINYNFKKLSDVHFLITKE